LNLETVPVGAFCFGVVIGWVTYRTLRRSNETVALSNIATVVGAVGGAAVTALFPDPNLFAWYCIGLAIGFFVYLLLAVTILRDTAWLSRDN
jgi:hypothetical protein